MVPLKIYICVSVCVCMLFFCIYVYVYVFSGKIQYPQDVYTHRKRPNRVLVYHCPCVCCPCVTARWYTRTRLRFLCVYTCFGDLILTGHMGFSQLNLIMSISKEFEKNKPPKIIFTYNYTINYFIQLYFLTLF